MAATNTRESRSPPVAGWLVGFLAIYFAAQVVLRVLYASSLGRDEAEAVILAQSFAVGYGPQPPLYTWLQMGLFEIFGPGIFSLALLKNLLLWATFVFMFLSARIVLNDDTRAALATLVLFTIPQIAWESQRALAHTVIAVTLAAATFYFMLLLLKHGRWRDYFAFGACAALGTLSKYNYDVFAVALLLTPLTMPGFRQRVLSPRMLAALVLALILLSPHLIWVFGHVDETLSRLGKFNIVTDASVVETAVRGIAATVSALISYSALPVLAFATIALLPSGQTPRSRIDSPDWLEGRAFVLRLVPVSLILLLALVLISRSTGLRDRWLQPILFVLPLFLLILLEQRLAGPRGRMLGALSIVLAVAAMIGLAAAHILPDLSRAAARTPYGPIAAEIRERGFAQGIILSNDNHISGNLKHRFPDSIAATPEYRLWTDESRESAQAVLLAWTEPEPSPPTELIELWRGLCGDATDIRSEPFTLTAPFEGASSATFTLRAVIVPMCATPATITPSA